MCLLNVDILVGVEVFFFLSLFISMESFVRDILGFEGVEVWFVWFRLVRVGGLDRIYFKVNCCLDI